MNLMPKIYNMRNKNIPKEAIYVGRPTKWGNPFSCSLNTIAKYRVATREEAIAEYEIWLYTSGLVADIEELKGKDLICWCAPLSCHANILLNKANK